MSRQCS